MPGQVYPRLRSLELDPGGPKGPELGLRARAEVQKLGPGKELRVKFRHYSGVLRGCSRPCSGLAQACTATAQGRLLMPQVSTPGAQGLKTEMDFGEVKIRV